MEKRSWWLFGVILILALMLRIPQLNSSFWLDESAQALESSRPLNQQLNIRDDFQPPLLHVVIHFALYVSRDEWWLRTIGAVVPGILSILGTLLIAQKVLPKKFNSSGTLLVGLLLATNSFHLFYSQELRQYAFPMALAVWSWWCLLHKKPTKKIVIGWATLSLLGLYSSYIYPFLLLSQVVFLVVSNRKISKLKSWLAGLLAVVLGFVPWLPAFLDQLQAGQLLRLQLPNWETAVSTSQLKVFPLVFAKFIFGVLDVDLNLFFISSIAVILVLIVLVVIGIYRSLTQKKQLVIHAKTFAPIIIWLFVPLMSAWLVSFFIPVIQPKRVLFILPAFYLTLSLLFVHSQTLGFWFRRAGCALIALILGINLFSVHQYYSNPRLQRENWREVLSSVSKRYPQSFTLSSFPAPFAPIDWYRPRLITSPLAQDLASGLLFIDSPTTAQQIITDVSLLKMTDTMIYFEYLTDLTDPNHYLRDAIENSGYELHDLLDYPGIGFVRIYHYTPIYALGN